MNWSDTVNHFAKGDFTSRNEAVFILICDAVCVSGQDNQIALGFTDEEGVLADRADSRRPDGLVVAADFSQFVFFAVLAGDVFDDADTFH